MPWREALEAPLPDRVRRSGGGDGLLPRASARRWGRRTSCAATSAARPPTCRSSSRASRSWTNTFELEHDLIINALSTEISSVGAGGGSIVSISPSGDVLVGPGERGRRAGAGLLRPGRRAADGDRRLPAHGHPRPGRLRRRRGAPRLRPRVEGVRGAGVAAVGRAADRVRVPHRGEQHRRGGHEHRDPPRRRPARLHRCWPTARPARCCCRRRSSCCTSSRSSSRRTPGSFSALGLLSTDLVYSDSRSSLRRALARRRAADRGALRGDGGGTARARRGRRRRLGPAQLRRPPLRPELGDAVHRAFRTARSTGETIERDGRVVPRGVRAALRQHASRSRCRASPTASQLVVAGRQGRVHRRRGRRRGAAADPDRASCATTATSRCRRASTPARSCRPALPCRVPRSSARGCRPRSCAPGRSARSARSASSSSVASRRRTDHDPHPRPRRAGLRGALRLRSLHRDRPVEPLRLRRRAHVQPAPHDGVLADPARLLRLRRHGHRSAEQRLPHAGGVATRSSCSRAR